MLYHTKSDHRDVADREQLDGGDIDPDEGDAECGPTLR
jgi:hypothetical protein